MSAKPLSPENVAGFLRARRPDDQWTNSRYPPLMIVPFASIGSCARPCGSERASGNIIDEPRQEGADCGSTSPRSLDEFAQLRTHTAHYSPVMIAPLSINSSAGGNEFFLDAGARGKATRSEAQVMLSLSVPRFRFSSEGAALVS
jgi:hypothetical protein